MAHIEVIIRITLATVIGGIIGYERAYNNRPAGFRTHILVCVGACLVSLIQISSVDEIIKMIEQKPFLSEVLKADVGRMGAQVISGIGFLGAGTILQQKGNIKGLTTAASVWSVGCVGLAIGMGYYFLSGIATLFIMLSLTLLKSFEERYVDKSRLLKLQIVYEDKEKTIAALAEYFDSKDIKVKNIEFSKPSDEAEVNKIGVYTIVVPRFVKDSELIQKIVSVGDVIKITII